MAFQLIPQVLLGIFKLSDTFVQMGTVALRVISIHFPIAAVCIEDGVFSSLYIPSFFVINYLTIYG